MTDKTNSHPYSGLEKCDTNNATRIGWNDWWDNGKWPADYRPENKQDYYQYLDRLNSGLQNGRKHQNSSYETYALNRNLIQCISDKLRMNSWEIKRAIKVFDGLQRSGMGISSKIVAFSTCAYLIHEYDSNRQYHPQTKNEDQDYFLDKCRKEFDIRRDSFESMYGKISYKIRNNKLNFRQYDKYEIDSNAQQRWRTRDSDGKDWL